MKQILLRLREPAVVVVLVVLALRVLLAPASFVYFLRGGAGGDALSLAFFSMTYTATDPLTVVVLAALLATCALTAPTPHVRLLTVWSLVVAGLGVLLALLGAIGWLTQLTPVGLTLADAARVFLGLVVPVLAVIAVVGLLRAQPRAAQQTLALDSGTTEPEAAKVVEPVKDPANEPTWQPDVASGAAWLKAGDAASGAAASGWGKPGEVGGWLPQSSATNSDPQSDDSQKRGPARPSARTGEPRPPELEQRPHP